MCVCVSMKAVCVNVCGGGTMGLHWTSSDVHAWHMFNHTHTHTVKPILAKHSPPQTFWFTGETVTLQARVASASPNTGLTVAWSKDSASVPFREFMDNGSVVYQVEIPNVGVDQVGMYVCEVTNSIGTGRLEFNVAVYGELNLTSPTLSPPLSLWNL